MEKCSNCREEMLPDFDFCHHCGAAVSVAASGPPARGKIVEMADELGDIVSRSTALGNSANQAVNDFLGGPTSFQRRICFALLAGLTVVLAYKLAPVTQPVQWLERWLVISALLLPFISYWMTGFVPFVNVLNAILGDVFSLRRRVMLIFFFSGPLSLSIFGLGIFAWMFRSEWSGTEVTQLDVLGVSLGHFLLSYYLMGHTTLWKPVLDSQRSHFLDRMSKDAERVANRILDQLQDRGIPGLEIVQIELARLSRFTGGESRGRQGRQIIFTSGRARIVLFVQDFGDSLLIRWGAYFDASGRRLWVLFGLVFSSINSIYRRWTGIDVPKVWGEFVNVLKPVSRHQHNLMGLTQGGPLTRLFGMAEGITEYGWNEIYALHGAISDTVGKVASSSQAVAEHTEAIESEIARYARFEGQTPFGASGFGTKTKG